MAPAKVVSEVAENLVSDYNIVWTSGDRGGRFTGQVRLGGKEHWFGHTAGEVHDAPVRGPRLDAGRGGARVGTAGEHSDAAGTDSNGGVGGGA